ncbi:triose-phosphate isomerase [Pleionea sediminis]|uniref:triose-phosphate isomerase n=1 Tax=Pleionea sediminis TaxID=2569479 RepID=UPI0011862F4F|nr:triose-phosphate isomerase [Pleionea sediminis]
MSRRSIVAGNWKMNGSPDSIKQLMDALLEHNLADLKCDIIVCPPALFVERVLGVAGNRVAVGAQNVNENDKGAFTGEISAQMLKSIGCKYAIVGHSERRQLFAETSEQVALKASALLELGLTPILCVGETLEQREGGETLSVVKSQIDAVVNQCGIKAFERIVIAYEPVWAIGTGKTASPQQAQEVHSAIRMDLAKQDKSIAEGVSILYGGSVKADNAAELFSEADIDGGLIGGASLIAEDFYQICRAAG